MDQEQRTTARSYACALHPHTLKLLERLGLARELLAHGRRVGKVAFYDGAERQAELTLSDPGGEFPFLLILPQNVLEQVLEQRLRQRGVPVHWNHRFVDCAEEESSVAVTVEELEGTSTGYIVPHWETVVKERTTVRAQFLVGADGHNSTVRQKLGLGQERIGEPEMFAAYEFETEPGSLDEVRVVLDSTSTNVLWPLPGNRLRWAFQLLHGDAKEFPEKERRGARLAEPQADERICQHIRKMAGRRAPWFADAIKDLVWCSEVGFERKLVKSFGSSRCWVAGDAAHQTGPVGVQSMNAGFVEGKRLAGTLRKILQQQALPELLATGYGQEQTNEWRRSLGFQGGLQGQKEATAWVREHAQRLLPCLPGGGDDLSQLAAQIHLGWAPTPENELSLSRKV